MAKVEDVLSRLHALRGVARSGAAVEEFRGALGSKTNLVVAKAAGIVGEFGVPGLAGELEAAFERLVRGPASGDRGCAAKLAIAKALSALGEAAPQVFLAGARHVQMEPSYGGPVDVAAELRGECVIALVRSGHRGATAAAVEMLVDKEPAARGGAARALGALGSEAAAMALRLKCLVGDASGDVLAECFASVASIDPGSAVEFLGRFLGDPRPEYVEAAALGLGATRRPAALAQLCGNYGRCADADVRRTLLVAMATLRLPEAVEFLMSQLADGPAEDAMRVVEALSIYRHDEAMRLRVGQVVEKRKDARLRATYGGCFG